MENSASPGEAPDGGGLRPRRRDPHPGAPPLPAEADLSLRYTPADEEVKRARELLPELDESE